MIKYKVSFTFSFEDKKGSDYKNQILEHIIFSVYDIWRTSEFPAIHRGFHLAFDFNSLIHSLTTVKGAKKNTSPNVIHLQYTVRTIKI